VTFYQADGGSAFTERELINGAGEGEDTQPFEVDSGGDLAL